MSLHFSSYFFVTISEQLKVRFLLKYVHVSVRFFFSSFLCCAHLQTDCRRQCITITSHPGIDQRTQILLQKNKVNSEMLRACPPSKYFSVNCLFNLLDSICFPCFYTEHLLLLPPSLSGSHPSLPLVQLVVFEAMPLPSFCRSGFWVSLSVCEFNARGLTG